MSPPIQIPTLDRGPTPEPGSIGRINTQVADDSKDISAIGAAASKLGEDEVKYQIGLQHQKADTEGSAQAARFREGQDKILDGDPNAGTPGLVHQKGDPTPLYANFDKNLDAEFKKVVENPDYSDITRGYVYRAMLEQKNQLHRKATIAYGNQNAAYTNDVSDASVNMESNNLIDASVLVDPKDPATMVAVDKHLGNMQDIRLKQAMKNGSAVVVKDGEPYDAEMANPDPNAPPNSKLKLKVGITTQQQINKDQSAGTVAMIENLINSKKLDSAKMLMDRYSGQGVIDGQQMQKLTGSYTKANTDQEAYDALDKANQIKDPTKAQAYLDSIKDPEVQHRAKELKDSNDRFMQNSAERSSKDAFNHLGIMIDEKQNSDEPFADRSMLEENPVFKRLITRVTDEKQREALYKAVEKPKNTNQDDLAHWMDLYAGDKIKDLSPTEFMQATANFNDEDRRRARTEYDHFRSPETDAAERSKSNYVVKLVREQAMATGLVGVFHGNVADKDVPYMNQLQIEAQKEMDNMPKGTSVTEQTNRINAWLGRKKIEQHQSEIENNVVKSYIYHNMPQLLPLFDKGILSAPAPIQEAPELRSSPVVPGGVKTKTVAPSASSAGVTTPTVASAPTLDAAGIKQAREAYKKANGEYPASFADLNKFIQDSNKKSK